MTDKSDIAQLLSAKINHIVEPKRPDVEMIEGCHVIDFSSPNVNNFFFKKGDDEAGKYVSPRELFELMLKECWTPIMIGWTREDGHTNFGQPPCVNHKLVAVMVKLKKN